MHSPFSLNRERIIQDARAPFVTERGVQHYALTDEQEWKLRRDFALMDAQRACRFAQMDLEAEMETTDVFVRE